jgi:hypothetical protein
MEVCRPASGVGIFYKFTGWHHSFGSNCLEVHTKSNLARLLL